MWWMILCFWHCVLIHVFQKVILLVYLYDVLALSPDEASLSSFVKEMRGHLDISNLGRAKCFRSVCLQKSTDGFTLCQPTYTNIMLRRLQIEHCKAVCTPMVTRNLVENEKSASDKSIYREIIGSLIYLWKQTKPDISATVSFLSRKI